MKTIPWKFWLILLLIGANVVFFAVYRSSRKVDPLQLAATGHLIAVELEDYKARHGSFPAEIGEAIDLGLLKHGGWTYQRTDRNACLFFHRTGLEDERVEVRLGEEHFGREGAYVVSGEVERGVGWRRSTKEEREAREARRRKELEELEV